MKVSMKKRFKNQWRREFSKVKSGFLATIEDKQEGGEIMARDLKKAAEEKVKEEQKKPAELAEDKPAVQVITSEQFTQNKLDYLIAIVHEGFRQVGVKFDEPKDQKKD